VKFYEKKHGVHSLGWGALEWDPAWRQRSLLLELEKERRELTPVELLADQPCDTGIEFICGLPGGGKSFYSVKLLIDELMYGHRPIVTNEALVIARLQEYLHEMGHRVHIMDRVHVMPPDEVYEFYLWRHGGLKLQAPKNGEFMDWSAAQADERAAGGVFYLIAECHNWFHVDAEGKLGKLAPDHPLMQWASQHRKLKDLCFFQTQSVENVHVKIRRLGQRFHYIRNYRRETYRGFRRGDGFMRTTYLKQPKTETAVPIEEKPFSLDVRGVGSCYRTAAGVGIAGKGVADGGKQVKGFHMLWLWAIAAVALVGGIALLFVLARLLLKTAVDQTVGIRQDIEKKVGVAPKEAAPARSLPEVRPAEAVRSTRPNAAAAPARQADAVTMLGYVARDRTINVLLSDGRVITEADPELLRVTRQFVELRDGSRYYFKRPASSGSALANGGASTGRNAAPQPDGSSQARAQREVPLPSGEGEGARGEGSSWYTDRDGVQRLRESPSFSKAALK